MCAVVLPVSPLPIYPSSTKIIFRPAFNKQYAVVSPAMPPPTIKISVSIFSFSFSKIIGFVDAIQKELFWPEVILLSIGSCADEFILILF